MGRTFVEILPLALGGAISPVVLLLQLATLASRSHPVTRAFIVLAATTLVVAIVTLVVVIGDHRATAGVTPTGAADLVGAWIRIVLAVLLLGTALRLLLTDRPADTASPSTSPDAGADQPLRPARFFLLGVGAMATNATTLVLLIPAVHTVATAGLRSTQELSLYVTIALIVLLPAYLPLVALGAMGRRGPAVLADLSGWLRTHNRTIEIAVSLGFAVFLGWSGFSALA